MNNPDKPVVFLTPAQWEVFRKNGWLTYGYHKKIEVMPDAKHGRNARSVGSK